MDAIGTRQTRLSLHSTVCGSAPRLERRRPFDTCLMTSLFKHLRIHQIFGANTDVGKTILTTALVRASAVKGKNVFYLKPVSTGALEDADDLYVSHHALLFLKTYPLS